MQFSIEFPVLCSFYNTSSVALQLNADTRFISGWSFFQSNACGLKVTLWPDCYPENKTRIRQTLYSSNLLLIDEGVNGATFMCPTFFHDKQKWSLCFWLIGITDRGQTFFVQSVFLYEVMHLVHSPQLNLFVRVSWIWFLWGPFHSADFFLSRWLPSKIISVTSFRFFFNKISADTWYLYTSIALNIPVYIQPSLSHIFF